MSINTAVFNGNLTSFPNKFGTKENPVIAFSIAVNCRMKKDGEWGEVPLFVDCTMFGKRAVSLYDILEKGMNVTVSGRMEPNAYEDKAGNTVKTFRLIVSDVALPPKHRTD